MEAFVIERIACQNFKTRTYYNAMLTA